MPADKDAAKRRRQARNRQERQNRQARTEGAKRAAARPSRTAEEVPTRSGRSGAKAGSGGKGTTAKTDLSKPATGRPSRTAEDTAAAPSGIMGKLFPPRPQPADGDGEARPVRPVRIPSEVVEVDAGPGPRGQIVRYTAQPGGLATVLAFLIALVSAATLLAFPVWPSPDLTGYGETVVRSQLEAEGARDGDIDDAVEELQRSSLEQLRGVEFGTPGIFLVVMIAALPVIICFFAVRSLLRPTRSRTLMWSAIAGGAAVVFNLGTGIYFVPGVIGLGFAAYQSAKVDKAAAAASA